MRPTSLLPALLALLLPSLVACGGDEPPASRAPAASAAVGTRPVLDADGVPRDCAILLADGLCYPTAVDACRAASCPMERCEILEIYPGRLRCQPAGEVAP